MVNLTLYRAAFLPAVLALVVVAFAFGEREGPIRTTLAPDAFGGGAALSVLEELDEAGDTLPAVVERTFRASGFATRLDEGERGRAVVGERVGRARRRLVLVAHVPPGATPSQLASTAVLLELARLFEGRATRRSLTLAWVQDDEPGLRELREVAETFAPERVDAVLVLGDVGGRVVRPPVVVPWSESGGRAPNRLRRTVEEAVRLEAGIDAGSPRALVQFARYAVPMTLAPQGAFGARGLSAVTLSAGGERGPVDEIAVSRGRLQGMGRAALRSVTALDNGPDVPSGPSEALLVAGRVLPPWTVSLMVAVLLLPALLATVDGLARVRRRREPVAPWLVWVAAAALPFAVAGLVARLLGVTGGLPAPPGPLDPRAVDVPGGGVLVLVLLVALGFAVRPVLGRWAGVRARAAGEGGAAAAVGLVLCAVAIGVWAVNPFTAALLLPAVHLWLLAAAPEVRSRAVSLLLVVAGLVPFALVALYYAGQFGIGAGGLAWLGTLLVSGGYAGPVGVLAWSAVLGCLVATVLAAVRRAPPPAAPPAPVLPATRLSVLEPVVRR